MERYTIYCTEEQTRKAFELGAPITQTHANPSIAFVDKHPMSIWVSTNEKYIDEGYVLAIPTAEQMINWLEDKGISVKASCFSWCNENKPTWQVHAYYKPTDFWDEIAFGHSKSCKEAILAAIDAALDYLSKTKEHK